MALFAIADLHLSFYKDKPMDIFGDNWKNHPEKIRENWQRLIKKEDTVLLPGDISWAKNFEELEPDMEFIRSLNGKKVILSGNHDYWWSSISRMNELYPEIVFLKNNCYIYENIAIAGSKGWLCPNDTYYTEHDEKLYKRECNRLELSLREAEKYDCEKIILMMHFPPTNDKKENSEFVNIIKNHNIKEVIYGHLHGKESFESSLLGEVEGVNYSLVSSDYLNFVPKKIMD